MASMISTTFALCGEDGDLGDPRGALEVISATRGEDAAAGGLDAIACSGLGARTQIPGRAARLVSRPDDTEARR